MSVSERWIRSTFLRGAALAFAAALSGTASAQEPVQTNRATELRAAPDDTAVLIRTLPQRTPVEQLERKGAWTRVKVDRDAGWVRMMHLRGGAVIVESEKTASGGFLSGFSRLLGGSSASNTRAQSATVGIRGFSEEDLRKAQMNPAEFAKLKRFQAGDAESRRLAEQASLQARDVAYLPQDAVDGLRGGR